MNPYLEQSDVWQDFHRRFCAAASELLLSQLQPTYHVRLEAFVTHHESTAEKRMLECLPDATITRFGEARSRATGARAIQAPYYAILPTAVAVQRQSYIEIRARDDRQLATVISMLIPENKMAEHVREQYLVWRRELLWGSSVHLVEIDLLRGGPRLPFEEVPECDYYVMVSRAEKRPSADIWPLKLREPLPTVPIPLRSGAPDAQLDLQAVLHRIHDAAGYEDYIYTGQPQPPLQPEDAAWSEQLIPTQDHS